MGSLNGRKVKYAKLREPAFVTGLGNIGDTLRLAGVDAVTKTPIISKVKDMWFQDSCIVVKTAIGETGIHLTEVKSFDLLPEAVEAPSKLAKGS